MRDPLSAAVRRGVPALVIAFAALSAVLPAAAATKVLGDLPRRGWLGVQFAPGPDGHPTIAKVIPGGSAEKAGLKAGDALLAVNGTDTATPGTIAATLGRMHAGETAKLRVRREEEEVDKNVKLVAMPFEKSDEFDILYDVVDTEGARLRSVVVKPLGAKGKLPAILFVQGLQCAPVDEPTGDPSTVLQLLHEMTRAGYSVMRCEKPGTGDATGEPCSEIDFNQEVGGFRAAPREAAPLRLRGHEPRLHLRSQLGRSRSAGPSPRRRRCAACGWLDDSDPVGGVSRGQRASPNAPRSFGRPRGAGDENRNLRIPARSLPQGTPASRTRWRSAPTSSPSSTTTGHRPHALPSAAT